jgi:hypothetical protein
MKYPMVIVCSSLIFASCQWAQAEQPYGKALCHDPDYYCITVRNGESWSSLWPNETEQDIVQRVNRKNTRLYPGTVLAVPINLSEANWIEFSPLPVSIPPGDERTIIVDQNELAWGAYDVDGQMVRWGPISSGRDYCPDVHRACRTVTGTFHVYDMRGEDCISKIFPVGEGGAPMPYCMFFNGGFALHGSPHVPGYRDSHGCVRLFERDAQWLYYEFIQIQGHGHGTKVIIDKL